MVDTIKCDHCGAEANAKYVIAKEIDGKTLNFCCRGCLGVYEIIHEEGLANPIQDEKPGLKNSVGNKSV